MIIEEDKRRESPELPDLFEPPVCLTEILFCI